MPCDSADEKRCRKRQPDGQPRDCRAGHVPPPFVRRSFIFLP